eukprot:Ihof_evm10s154 gene=Ihof_evmTU10s154
MAKRKAKVRKVDFKTAKAKVGQQLAAANATKTDFKAKTIVVPAQSISEDKGDAVNQRNLTLKELLCQARHYNANVRKSSMHGLRDLFFRHPYVLTSNLGTIIEKIMPTAVDVELEPRQGLLALLTHITTALAPQQLAPFFPLIMVFVRSAMTHIRDDISQHALDFVEMLLANTPQLLVANDKDILLNFVRLLSKQNSGKASRGSGGTQVTSSAKTYGRVLTRLYAFIIELLPSEGKASSSSQKVKKEVIWNAQASLSSYPLGQRLCDQSHGSLFSTLYEAATAGTINSGDLSERGWAGLSDNRLSNDKETLQFIQCLMPRLIEAWVETSPAVLGPSQVNNMAVGVMQAILDISRQLWCHLYRKRLDTGMSPFNAAAPLAEFAKDIKRHWMPAFPLGEDREVDDKLRQTLVAMNYDMCDIAGLLFLAERAETKGKVEGGKEKEPRGEGVPGWGQRVFSYVNTQLGVVPDETVLQGPSSPIATLLAVVETLLICVQGDSTRTQELLKNVLDLYNRLKPFSPAKPRAIAFLATHSLKVEGPQEVGLLFLSSLPKLLWQLGANHHQTTTDIIRVLSKVAVSSKPGSKTYEAMQALQPSFVPYLHTTVPTKQGGSRAIYGPFVSLPPTIQYRFLEFLASFSSPTPALLKTLAIVCLHQSVPGLVASYAVHMVAGSWGKSWNGMTGGDTLNPELLSSLVGFFITLVVGHTNDQLAQLEAAQTGSAFPGPTVALVSQLVKLSRETYRLEGLSLYCIEIPVPSVDISLPESVYDTYWAKRQAIVTAVCDGLHQLPVGGWEDLLVPLGNPILDIMKTHPALPHDSAVALLMTVTRLCGGGVKFSPFLLPSFTQLSLAVLAHSVTYPVKQPGCSQAVQWSTQAVIGLAKTVPRLISPMMDLILLAVKDCDSESELDVALLVIGELVRATALQHTFRLHREQLLAIINAAQ